MKILFLSLSRFGNINERGIYSDLMREFIKRGTNVYIASPTERRYKKKTHLIKNEHCQILKIETLNIQKTNFIEKGIGTLLLEYQFDRAIKKYWGNIGFDLVLYATPPITFNRVIGNIKKRCGAVSYLMLKDIFPQNAVDLGMISVGGLLHRMFRKKEKALYKISDKIGCMSPANCDYVITHNQEVPPEKIEVCPNAVEPIEVSPLSDEERTGILNSLNIPADKTLFIYGGNLGKPQGLDFLLEVIKANEEDENNFIIIIGSGTEYSRISSWFKRYNPSNAILLSALPKDEYDKLVRACHVGLIFLDPRFTIPNFPSRLISYLENSMPVLVASDTTTDMGRIAEREGFGFWSKSGDLPSFMENMERVTNLLNTNKMGLSGKRFLLNNYTVDKVVDIILKSSIKDSTDGFV